MKTIKFYTLGCKVNQYDTQSIRESFSRQGYKEIDNGRPADTYVINTCTVTARADRESLNLIRRAKRENPKARIIVTGCLAAVTPLREWVYTHSRNGGGGITYFKGHTRAFLKIQDGCDNFCAYCRVPLARGKPRSKKIQAIIDEARALVENGYKEIVLTGICLGLYGKDLKPEITLAEVIEELEKINGLLRIRLSSIEAADVSIGLIRRIAHSKKLCRHLHIPVQSGDDEILKKMNRRYTRKYYLDLIRRIKKEIRGVAITTDCLVGFPGESDKNFQNTVSLVKKIQPLKVHIFPYSPREGTTAYEMPNRVKLHIVKQRLKVLEAVSKECAAKYSSKFRKKKMKVLIEGCSKEDPLIWRGFSDNYIPVLVKSKVDLKNQLIKIGGPTNTPGVLVGQALQFCLTNTFRGDILKANKGAVYA